MFKFFNGSAPSLVHTPDLGPYFGQLDGELLKNELYNHYYPNSCCGARFELSPQTHSNLITFGGFENKRVTQHTKGVRIIPGKVENGLYLHDHETKHEVILGGNTLTIVTLHSHIKDACGSERNTRYKLFNTKKDTPILFPYFSALEVGVNQLSTLKFYQEAYPNTPREAISIWYERYTNLKKYTASAPWQVYILIPEQLLSFKKFVDEYKLTVLYEIRDVVNANYGPDDNPRLNVFVVKGN